MPDQSKPSRGDESVAVVLARVAERTEGMRQDLQEFKREIRSDVEELKVDVRAVRDRHDDHATREEVAALRKDLEARLATLATTERADGICERVGTLESDGEQGAVRRSDYAPVKRAVYAGIGVIVLAVLAALVAVVVKSDAGRGGGGGGNTKAVTP